MTILEAKTHRLIGSRLYDVLSIADTIQVTLFARVVCFCLYGFSVAVLFATGCGITKGPTAPVEISGSTMGTRYNIKLAGLPEEISAEKLKSRIDAELEKINDQMSTYRPASEISRFNRYDGKEWVPVSPETARVVTVAQRISDETQGAFDITVGPLVNLWSFGAEPIDQAVPGNEQIKEVREKVGRYTVDVRDDPPALRKDRSDVEIDLSAIAKGFAVDHIAELLDNLGVAGYLVEIGGEIRTRGTKTDGNAWVVGIEAPKEFTRGIQEVIALGDRALATSGDYRNFFEQDGKRYSHTIDPATGRPVEHNLASVSVVTEDCMHADAWATALMVLGPEIGFHFATERNLAVLFFVRGEEGFIRRPTPAFEQLFGGKGGSA